MLLNSLLTLTSISQWALFAGIGLIIFGWIEKQEKYTWAGLSVFILLGATAGYILLSGSLPVSEPVTDKELKVMGFIRAVSYFGILSGVSLLLTVFKIKFQVLSIYLVILFALALFFMLVNIQQMPN